MLTEYSLCLVLAHRRTSVITSKKKACTSPVLFAVLCTVFLLGIILLIGMHRAGSRTIANVCATPGFSFFCTFTCLVGLLLDFQRCYKVYVVLFFLHDVLQVVLFSLFWELTA